MSAPSRLPRRAVLCLLLVLVFASVLFRYPSSLHESGADSFVFHGLAQTIVDAKYAVWIVNPLSLFGLYPLSHPSGSILVVADLSELGAITAEGSILLFDMLTAVLGLLGAFLMAREIRPDDRFALVVAFLFSTAPRFVSSLEWQVPTRSLFTALVPIFVWSLLRLHRRVDGLHLGLLSVILLVMMTAHRLAVMMAIVMTAYVVAGIFVVSVRVLRTKYAGIFLANRLHRILRAGSWMVALLCAVYILLFSGVLTAYEQGQLGTGTGAAAQLANLAISLARTVGLLLPLVVVGVLAVYRSRATDIREPWLIAVFIGVVPTLSLRQYTGWYLMPFAAIFIGLGIVFIARALHRRPKLRLAVIVGIIVVSLVSSAYIVEYERGVEQYLSSSVYDGAIYARRTFEASFIANSGALGVQVHAISGLPYLPIGGSTTSFQGPEILAFGFMRPGDIHPRLIPIGDLTIEDDSLFILDNVNFEVIWADTLSRPLTDPYVQRQLHEYGLQYFVEAKDFWGQFEAYGNLYDSPFAASVQSGAYAVFDSNSYRAYFVAGPRG